MTTPDPACLILTLYSGENEYDRCRDSVREQCGVRFEHVVFEHLPNKQAHERLYETVMQRAAEFALCVKLDADTVLVDDGIIRRIVEFFAVRPELDHAQFELVDFLSDGPLWGMHVFSPRVRWQRNDEDLFVDPDPVVPGLRLVVRGERPVAHHSPDPSPYQAFHFGVHRALKAFQPGRRAFNHDQARKQWGLLTRVWDHFESGRDPRPGFAVLGADLVWTGQLTSAGSVWDDPSLRSAFDEHAALGAAELHARLGDRWTPGIARSRRWALTVGPRVARGMVASRLSRLVGAGGEDAS